MNDKKQFNVLNSDGLIIHSDKDHYKLESKVNSIAEEISEVTQQSWGCDLKREEITGFTFYSAKPLYNSQYQRIWFIFKRLTPAQRSDPNEYRCQISDFKLMNNKKLKISEMGILGNNEELFLPIGYYKNLDAPDLPLILSIIDPSKLGTKAKNRSYYVDLARISEAWRSGFSLHFDIEGQVTISTKKESFPAFIEYLKYFYVT